MYEMTDDAGCYEVWTKGPEIRGLAPACGR